MRNEQDNDEESGNTTSLCPSAMFVSHVAVETGPVGELAGAADALEGFDVVVGVHVALKVALEVEPFAADVTGEGGTVQVNLVDVAAQAVG